MGGRGREGWSCGSVERGCGLEDALGGVESAREGDG